MKTQKPARRGGAILVKFAILVPVLFAWVGLVIDTGLLLSTKRQMQNAADAAALAAAMDLLRIRQGVSLPHDLTGSARNYAHLNGLEESVEPEVYNPPATGPYAGDDNYVEVVITKPLRTWFIQVVGVNTDQEVRARAVAGLEASTLTDVLVVLNPNPSGQGAGLDASGGGTIQVFGSIRVNAEGSKAILPGSQLGKGTGIFAENVTVVGDIGGQGASYIFDNSTYPNSTPLDPSKITTGDLPASDPYAYLATPTLDSGVVNATNQGDVSYSVPKAGETLYIEPGIYSSISITGGNAGTVEFKPGIYVLSPTHNVTNTLVINNSGGQVIGNGVMFYNTGSDYSATSGLPDSQDGFTLGSSSAFFGGININTQSLTLTPYRSAGSPFDGMVFYQRRWNTEDLSVQANASNVNVTGAIYDKWGAVKLAGGGASFNSPFVVGSLNVTGSATLRAPTTQESKPNQVYLVE